jgi:DegV family protein with EDD domain
LPPSLAARYGIWQVPINVHFGDETFRTGTDIDDKQLFERVDREGQLPTTSAPSPGQFVEAFEAAFERGAEAILCFCVSGRVSATQNAAVIARDLMSDRDITVLDTCSLTMGQGLMVLSAARALEEGASKEQAVVRAMDVGERTKLHAALPTLKYLAMSGRVGHLAAGMATLLNVKPIMTIREGQLDLLERVRSWRKARTRVMELTVETVGHRPVEQLAICHVCAREEAQAWEEEIRSRLRCPDEIIISELTPGLSVHSGAGLIGIAVTWG